MISVILPVYKNASFLAELTCRIHRVLDEIARPHEIICVNDCCPAGSWEVLSELAKHDQRLVAIDLLQNVGQHKAVLVGLAHAYGDWVAVMDADLQDPPEELPALIAAAERNLAVVFAGRCGVYQSKGRHLTSWVFKRVLALTARVPVDAGMFFVAPRNVKDALLRLPVSRPFVVAMLGAMAQHKLSHPVERCRRPSGKSSYSLWRRLRVGISAIASALQFRLGLAGGRPPDYTGFVRAIVRNGGLPT